MRSAGEENPARQAERGFTLIELLVVISIIGVLAGMVMGGMNVVRKKALITTTTTSISTLKVALGVYHQQMGIYPGSSKRGQPPRDDPEAIFRGLYTGNPKFGGTRDSQLDDWKADMIGIWPGRYVQAADASYERPTAEQLVFATTYTPCVLLDSWGRPFHYVEWDSQPRTQIQLPGTSLKRRGSVSFMIWSDGPNLTNDWGEGDDVVSW